jgi:hypothetical protein
VRAVGEPDPIVVVLSGPIGLGTVDALARLQLAVRELGGRVCLRAAPDELVELLVLAGLREIFGEDRALGDGGRQAEEREEPLGVEEEADP